MTDSAYKSQSLLDIRHMQQITLKNCSGWKARVLQIRSLLIIFWSTTTILMFIYLLKVQISYQSDC